ncbi:hypothetical protein Bbelb_380420 [Branchiostoma belcheri]|nr:hypothetical protein Bbelb_380420 [Branchiostoma belcheri]
MTKRRRDLIARTPTEQPLPARLQSPTETDRDYTPDGHRRNWDRSPAWLERSPDWPIDRTETPWPDAADADKVLDGDYYSHWNPNGQGPWYIIFDLVAPYTLSKISITNNGDTTHDVSTFLLEASVSSDPYSWEDVVTVTEVAASSEVQEFGGFSAMGRFWKLTITQTYGTWQPWLREVNFFGERAGRRI